MSRAGRLARLSIVVLRPEPAQSPLPAGALRNLAGDPLVDRGWRRVEGSLRARGGRRVKAAPILAVLAVAVAFGGGIGAGNLLWGGGQPASVASVPDPPPDHDGDAPTIALLATGSDLGLFDLPEGRITLAPRSTVEAERGAGGTRSLDLIQGEALLVLQPGVTPPLLVAGDARVSAEPGSVVQVRRRGGLLDVSVHQGGADLVSPSLEAHLGPGRRHLDVPIFAVPASEPAPPVAGPRPASPPAWYRRYLAHDHESASRLLRPAAVDRAIASAGSAAELMAIADLMARRGRDPLAATRARERVLERFPDDPRAVVAAEQLAAAHPGLALTLALRQGNDALICEALRREPDRARAAQVARTHLAAHPASDCREDLARIGTSER